MLLDRRVAIEPSFRWLVVLLVCTVCVPCVAADLDPGDATWTIRVENLWGAEKHLDVYPTFADGKWDRAIATSRVYNTPWWVPAKNHKPVKPGEHPRLFFSLELMFGGALKIGGQTARFDGRRIVLARF